MAPTHKSVDILASDSDLDAILSATELKKPVSRQEPKGASFTLATDKPWDTLKAQLLAKICHGEGADYVRKGG
jgi:hypothetical protein